MKLSIEKWSSVGITVENEDGAKISHILPELCQEMELTDEEKCKIFGNLDELIKETPSIDDLTHINDKSAKIITALRNIIDDNGLTPLGQYKALRDLIELHS